MITSSSTFDFERERFTQKSCSRRVQSVGNRRVLIMTKQTSPVLHRCHNQMLLIEFEDFSEVTRSVLLYN